MPSPNQIKKQELVKELSAQFAKMNAGVVSHYSGVSVEKFTELRKKCRENNIGIRVIKNSLATRAIKDTPLESLNETFSGPTALAYTETDPVGLAKVLVEFSKEEEHLKIQAGVLKGKLIDGKEVVALAKLPSREVLLAQLVGSLQSPYAGFVYTLSGVLRKFVYALDAVRRKKEEEGK